MFAYNTATIIHFVSCWNAHHLPLGTLSDAFFRLNLFFEGVVEMEHRYPHNS